MLFLKMFMTPILRLLGQEWVRLFGSIRSNWELQWTLYTVYSANINIIINANYKIKNSIKDTIVILNFFRIRYFSAKDSIVILNISLNSERLT